MRATRDSPDLSYGASPRSGAMLAAAARARAALDGRDYVIPDDVKALALPALRHRVMLSPAAEIDGRKVDDDHPQRSSNRSRRRAECIPRARMIAVALLGVPLALLAAMSRRSSGWSAARGWCSRPACFCSMRRSAADPSSLTLRRTCPASSAWRAPETASVQLRFARCARPRPSSSRSTPASCSSRGAGAAESPSHGRRGAARLLRLTPLRRGEGRSRRCGRAGRGRSVWCGSSDRHALDAHGRRSCPTSRRVKEEARAAVPARERPDGLARPAAQRRGHRVQRAEGIRSPAMDRRMIDWKQTARHGRLLAREFQVEENLHIVFALDTGRLMCEPLAGLPRIDRAIQAMLLLAYVGAADGRPRRHVRLRRAAAHASARSAGPTPSPRCNAWPRSSIIPRPRPISPSA